MITDIGMDLDGVIYPFANAFKRYCAIRQGKLTLPDPTHWHFYEDWGMDEKTFHEWLDDAALNHEVFATELPYEGVVEAWKELRAMGIKIHVITSRPQSSWAQTVKWLEDMGLKADSLHFNPTKGFLKNISKGEAIMIDDHVQYYEEAERNGIIPVLMTRTWNQDREGATRVNNLAEFVSLIRGYNLVKKMDAKKISKDVYKHYVEPYEPQVKKLRELEPHVNPYIPRKKFTYEDWHWRQA